MMATDKQNPNVPRWAFEAVERERCAHYGLEPNPLNIDLWMAAPEAWRTENAWAAYIAQHSPIPEQDEPKRCGLRVCGVTCYGPISNGKCGRCGALTVGLSERELPELHPVAYRYRYVYHQQGRVGNWQVRQRPIASSPGSATMAGVDVQPLYIAPPLALEDRMRDVSGRLERYLDRRRADGKGPDRG